MKVSKITWYCRQVHHQRSWDLSIKCRVMQWKVRANPWLHLKYFISGLGRYISLQNTCFVSLRTWFNPQNLHFKNPDMEMCVYEPSSEEVQRSSYLGVTVPASLTCWVSGGAQTYLLSFRPVEALTKRVLKSQTVPENYSQQCPLAFMCM